MYNSLYKKTILTLGNYMRTILQLASFYGKVENLDFTVGIKYIQEALKAVIIKDEKVRTIVYDIFNFEEAGLIKFYADSQENHTLKGLLNSCKNEHNISCDEDVRAGLYMLQVYGIDLNADNSFYPKNSMLPDDYEPLKVKKIRKKDRLVFEHEPIDDEEVTYITRRYEGFNRLQEINKLKRFLNSKVLNQKIAVEAVCDALVKEKHISNSSLPNGIFFFLGPPATGKTYLAQLLSENIDEYKSFKSFNMTQFTHEGSGGDLYGTARHWGNAKPGTLTSFVHNNPNSIIIFDEFEKAHTNVQTALFSLLSEGKMEDACGWCPEDGKPWTKERSDDILDEYGCSDESKLITEVDFSNCIVIFTSNLGKEVYNNQELMKRFATNPGLIERMTYDSISKEKKFESGHEVNAINAAFISRLKQGSMVLFNYLDYKELRIIAKDVLETEKKVFEKSYSVKIDYEEEVLDIILLNYGPSFDVRAIKASIGKYIFDSITGYYMDNKQVNRVIKISLDKEAKNIFKEMASDPDSLKKKFTRKNRTLNFTLDSSQTKTIHKIVFTNLLVETSFNADAYADGGISIEVPEISFEEIAGHTFVKEKLTEIVGLLNNYKDVCKFGIKPSKGILLYGPPGTGKTMLAKALAHEADLPFIATTGEELINPEKIDKVFSTAREYAPSIIFIDEIDAIPRRNTTVQTDIAVNKLLAYIDGFSTKNDEPVFIIAATNRKEKIDGALLRSGRIDLHVEINTLDYEARKYFLDRMLNNQLFDKNINIDEIVKFTTGLNGSDLEKIQRESVLYTYRHKLKNVTHEILLEQVNTIKYGKKLDNKNLEQALEETAYHEAGHAVMARILLPSKRIEQVTVMPRDNTLGFVSFNVERDEHSSSNVYDIKNEICVALAGRVAQMKKFGESGMDYGAISDLKSANRLAYKAIAYLGMDNELKNLSIDIFDTDDKYLENKEIPTRVQVWIDTETKRTQSLVNEYWSSIESLAKKLIVDEIVDEETLDEIIKFNKQPNKKMTKDGL